MPEAAKTEFWHDIKPIKQVFREGALPEIYASKIAEGDERYWVPISETVSSKPVWISPSKNMWADVLMSKSAGLVNRHYHPHPIWAYTISGKWAYLEHDWTATAGDFVYETPGREPHAGLLREPRADEGVLRRHRPADVARRGRQDDRPLRRPRLYRGGARPLCRRTASAPPMSTP